VGTLLPLQTFNLSLLRCGHSIRAASYSNLNVGNAPKAVVGDGLGIGFPSLYSKTVDTCLHSRRA
jgi:hypothetical protein